MHYKSAIRPGEFTVTLGVVTSDSGLTFALQVHLLKLEEDDEEEYAWLSWGSTLASHFVFPLSE